MFIYLDTNGNVLGYGCTAGENAIEYDDAVMSLDFGKLLGYRYVDGVFVFDEDRYNQMKVEPTAQDDTDAMLIDHEYRLTLLELGLSE